MSKIAAQMSNKIFDNLWIKPKSINITVMYDKNQESEIKSNSEKSKISSENTNETGDFFSRTLKNTKKAMAGVKNALALAGNDISTHVGNIRDIFLCLTRGKTPEEKLTKTYKNEPEFEYLDAAQKTKFIEMMTIKISGIEELHERAKIGAAFYYAKPNESSAGKNFSASTILRAYSAIPENTLSHENKYEKEIKDKIAIKNIFADLDKDSIGSGGRSINNEDTPHHNVSKYTDVKPPEFTHPRPVNDSQTESD